MNLAQALHEMFKDLALTVEQQGEMLNNIEKNVENAKDYVADAERECQQAVDYTNKFRKVRFKSSGAGGGNSIMVYPRGELPNTHTFNILI